MPSSDAELFAALGRAFTRLGARWYLFGAQAAILYGAARFTEDVDVTVELGELPTRALVSAFESEGFKARFVDDAFIERTRVVPFLHEATATPVDVVLAGPGLETLFFDAAVELMVEGVAVPVARAEDLVVMKILAGRPKDLEDVVAVVAAQGERFDVAETRRIVGLLEQALDQSDLMPLLETTLARAQKQRH